MPTPYPYQIAGIRHLAARNGVLLADDTGLGKTAQAILAASANGSNRILVVAPNYLLYKWAEQFRMWWPDMPQHSNLGDNFDEGVTFVNYEKIRPVLVDKKYHKWDYQTRVLKDLSRRSWDTLIVDEAHLIVNRHCAQRMGAAYLAKHADNVYLLTATPMRNEVCDLWSLLNILNPRKWSSYWRFAKEHADARPPDRNARPPEHGWHMNREATDPAKLQKEIGEVMLRRMKSEVQQYLPPKTYDTLYLEMDDYQKEIYDGIAKDMMVFLGPDEENWLITPGVLAQVTRLKQISVSPLLVGGESIGVKIPAMLDYLEGASGKVAVFSQFRAAVTIMANLYYKRFGVKPIMLVGGMDPHDREEKINQFQTDPDTRVVFGVTQACGLGIDLYAASTAIFLDRMYTPVDNTQVEDRLHRNGQENPVLILDILAGSGIELAIEKILRSKDTAINAVMG